MFFANLLGMLSADMAIDLGTANTLVYVKGRGIVLNEPSVVAIATVRGKKQVLAVGDEAKQMLGRTPTNITTVRPLRDGVIADYTVTEKMLQHFIRKVTKGRMARPLTRVVVCVPYGSTQVDGQVVDKQTADGVKHREVFYLIELQRLRLEGARLCGGVAQYVELCIST